MFGLETNQRFVFLSFRCSILIFDSVWTRPIIEIAKKSSPAIAIYSKCKNASEPPCKTLQEQRYQHFISCFVLPQTTWNPSSSQTLTNTRIYLLYIPTSDPAGIQFFQGQNSCLVTVASLGRILCNLFLGDCMTVYGSFGVSGPVSDQILLQSRLMGPV